MFWKKILCSKLVLVEDYEFKLFGLAIHDRKALTKRVGHKEFLMLLPLCRRYVPKKLRTQKWTACAIELWIKLVTWWSFVPKRNLKSDAFYAVEIKTMLGENFHNMMIVIRHGFNYLTSCHFFSVLEREKKHQQLLFYLRAEKIIWILLHYSRLKKCYSFIRHNKASERL